MSNEQSNEIPLMNNKFIHIYNNHLCLVRHVTLKTKPKFMLAASSLKVWLFFRLLAGLRCWLYWCQDVH